MEFRNVGCKFREEKRGGDANLSGTQRANSVWTPFLRYKIYKFPFCADLKAYF